MLHALLALSLIAVRARSTSCELPQVPTITQSIR
jgi:hypothetical protein